MANVPSNTHPTPEILTLRKRSEFVAMRAGRRQHMSTLLLQMKFRQNARDTDSQHTSIRVGYTVTKKTGNSVERNRIKRRLREAVKQVIPLAGRPQCDYVIIGKRAALNTDYHTIVRELGTALKRVHPKTKQSGHQHG